MSAKLAMPSLLLTLFLLSACGNGLEVSHYRPNEADLAQIEFDYPPAWTISKQPDDVSGESSAPYQQLIIWEPGSLPTPQHGRGNWIVAPYGTISIYSHVGEYDDLKKQLDFDMEFLIQDHRRYIHRLSS